MKTPKQEREARHQRRRIFAVRCGVYFAIMAGVIAQQAVKRFDAQSLILDLEFTGWNIGRVLAALAVAGMVYNKLDKGGELQGKAKNWRRTLMLGFTSGYTLMGIVGVGE